MLLDRSIIAFLTTVLIAAPQPTQELAAKSKIVGDLTADQIHAITEPRLRAGNELRAELIGREAPSIAKALGDPQNFIGIVTVTAINPPGNGSGPYLRVALHLEEVLRGDFKLTELHAESLWMPPRTQNDGVPALFSGPSTPSPFDLTEPKIGNRFLIGFSILYEDKGRAYIPGSLNLDDHDQAQIFPDAQRFLSIESAAVGDNFFPFVEALKDHTQWIRDLSARRLVQSDTCYASPVCKKAFLDSARQLLLSKSLADRWEALIWLEPVSQPMGERKDRPNGLPTMADKPVRELLVSALSDSNVSIADKAFGQLELFDFYHSSEPDECIEIVPALRKSARWTAEEAKGVAIGGRYNFGFTWACNPGPSL